MRVDTIPDLRVVGAFSTPSLSGTETAMPHAWLGEGPPPHVHGIP